MHFSALPVAQTSECANATKCLVNPSTFPYPAVPHPFSYPVAPLRLRQPIYPWQHNRIFHIAMHFSALSVAQTSECANATKCLVNPFTFPYPAVPHPFSYSVVPLCLRKPIYPWRHNRIFHISMHFSALSVAQTSECANATKCLVNPSTFPYPAVPHPFSYPVAPLCLHQPIYPWRHNRIFHISMHFSALSVAQTSECANATKCLVNPSTFPYPAVPHPFSYPVAPLCLRQPIYPWRHN